MRRVHWAERSEYTLHMIKQPDMSEGCLVCRGGHVLLGQYEPCLSGCHPSPGVRECGQ